MRINASREKTFLAEDRQFHAELLAPIGNQLAGQLVTAFWDIHSAVLPRLGLALPADLRKTAQAHADMLNAAQSGDRDAYRRAVVDHYEPLIRMLETTARSAAQRDPAPSEPGFVPPGKDTRRTAG
jgi:DNA-binding FadR family transcriptional regulator